MFNFAYRFADILHRIRNRMLELRANENHSSLCEKTRWMHTTSAWSKQQPAWLCRCILHFKGYSVLLLKYAFSSAVKYIYLKSIIKIKCKRQHAQPCYRCQGSALSSLQNFSDVYHLWVYYRPYIDEFLSFNFYTSLWSKLWQKYKLSSGCRHTHVHTAVSPVTKLMTYDIIIDAILK